MKQFLGFVLVANLAAAAPAVAQAQVQPSSQPPAVAPKVANADEVVCEKQEEIGSRLASHKVCHTRAQWQQIRLGDRSATERVQTMRSMDPSH